MHRGTPAHMRLPHRLQGQKVKSQGGAGAYCGGHLAAQLVFYARQLRRALNSFAWRCAAISIPQITHSCCRCFRSTHQRLHGRAVFRTLKRRQPSRAFPVRVPHNRECTLSEDEISASVFRSFIIPLLLYERSYYTFTVVLALTLLIRPL